MNAAKLRASLRLPTSFADADAVDSISAVSIVDKSFVVMQALFVQWFIGFGVRDDRLQPFFWRIGFALVTQWCDG